MCDRTANHASGRRDEPLRDLLAAVLEALDIPHPATVGDSEAHNRILLERVGHAKIALQTVLADDAPLGIDWTTTYLRERLAEHLPTGYVTYDQGRTALPEGKTWAQAVQAGHVASSPGGRSQGEDPEAVRRPVDPAPSVGPTGVQNVHDDAPTPYAVVRLDYQVTRQELFAALVFGFTETNPDRDPNGMTIAAIRREVEAYLASSSTADLSRAVEQVEAGTYTGAQLRRLEALTRAMGRAYPTRDARGGDAR